MHPVTRLGRVVQQLKSFGDLHASELDALAAELDSAGLGELAGKIRVYRDLQRDEGQLVIDELVDIRADLAVQSAPATGDEAPIAEPAGEAWLASPKRAAWLAAEAARNERARQPRMRRDLFRPSRDA
jgi:hypothetical protein